MASSSSRTRLLLLLLHVVWFAAFTAAYDFYVGGRDGWVLNPSESYNSWAGRMRFQVNDKLVFRYQKGEDSVLQVTKEAYNSCNRSKPIREMDSGDSVFHLDRSGPFFFISGVRGRCERGQKLIVVVLAVRHHMPVPVSPAPAPGPGSYVNPPPASSPGPSAEPPAMSPENPGGPLSPAYGPTSARIGKVETPGGSATTGSASTVVTVSRVSIATVSLVIGAVLLS